MKIGILSDIHGNIDALDAVIKSARNKGVEHFYICGDYVGYYCEPKRVIDRLNDILWSGVRGNHEEMLTTWINGDDREEINDKYGFGIQVAADTLTQADLSFLHALPKTKEIQIQGIEVLLCHGTPWVIDEYMYPDSEENKFDQLSFFKQEVIMFGHTHYPTYIETHGKRLVNPGSVGQPRDYKPGACWAVWDVEIDEFEFFRESYDISNLIEQCKKINKHVPFLHDVLIRRR